MRIAIIVSSLLMAVPVNAAEDFRVMKLEQDVRTLEREVQTLQRQLIDLQRQDRAASVAVPRTKREPPANEPDTWLNAAAWDRLRDGMSELAVIEILGKPTALRADSQDRRVLLYTLEISTTGFLTGSVVFAAGKVVEIQKPALR